MGLFLESFDTISPIEIIVRRELRASGVTTSIDEGKTISNGNGKTALIDQGLSKIRRLWLVKARRTYVRRRRSNRKGECVRCAMCCKLLLHCPFLRENRCAIYDNRFDQCKAFPIDEKDIALICKMGGKCGFFFGDNAR